ncbi:MAG: DUF3662 and FHA domain-containing protein [Ilumatobacteraceae bacterium]|jgi:hypothetical protein|nr:DUF3662 and FHA domain-containing protein [Ilumatobacteraceae bacterium]
MAGNTVERRFENLFDGLFSRAFSSKLTPLQIGRKLLHTIDAERTPDAQGRRVVPNRYVVQMSAYDREGFADLEPALIQELTQAVREYVRQEGYHAEGKVRVALRTNPDVRKGRVEITTENADVVEMPPPVVPEVVATTTAANVEPVEPVVPKPAASTFDLPPAVLTLPTGQRVSIHEGHYIVGRNLECDIVISDGNVSRQHAELVCAAGDVIVRDRASTNGTKVNGVAVHGDQLLQHGDVINFGTAQVRFEKS